MRWCCHPSKLIETVRQLLILVREKVGISVQRSLHGFMPQPFRYLCETSIILANEFYTFHFRFNIQILEFRELRKY